MRGALLLMTLTLLLFGCGQAPEYTFQNSGDGVQNISTGGPAVNTTGSPCAGNVTSTGAVSRSGGGEGDSAGAGTATTSPDCSTRTEPAPIITPVIVAEQPHSIAGPSILEVTP